jgi:hypothetical protein
MIAQDFKARIESNASLQPIFDFLALWDFSESACEVKIQAVGATLSHKAVFAIWMRHLAKSFTERDKTDKAYTALEMHDLMCHKYLGIVPARMIGKTEIPASLRTITYPEDLSRSEFYVFLRDVEIWASKVGVVMPDAPSEYQKDKEQNK